MDSVSPDCTPPFVVRTITEFLGEISMIGNVSERLVIIEERVRRLEDEMRKIDAFKRELPLCMLLLNDVIIALKAESMKCRKSLIQPVYEEFLPLKKDCDYDYDDDIHGDNKIESSKENDSTEKIKWTRSFKLWNGDKDYHISSHFNNIKHTFKSDLRMEELPGAPSLSLSTIDCSKPNVVVPSSASSSVITDIKARAQPLQQVSRKQRRCWSPELHKQFVNALQQLGGPQVATPKQIRELMQVEGLSNDEVKSHLQKYRLHIRRIPAGQSASESMFMPLNESSKQSSSQSGSPKGTLLLGASMSGSYSLEDDKSE